MSLQRTLFVGDIHGCSAELSALLAEAAPTDVVVLGDLFTKGPDPCGVWEQLCSLQSLRGVRGNHDEAVLKHREENRWGLPPGAFAWLEGLPHTLRGPGWVAVHAGLHPTEGLAGTTPQMATTVRRWPEDGRGETSPHPFWWEAYRGPGLVLYGHDARRGLVDRRPHTLGLDSGCVYGGALSGYLLEEDRVLQVPARRCYRPV